MKLFCEAAFKFLFGVVLVGALIFVPAGAFYFRGTAFMILLFAGIIMLINKPDFLKKRLDNKEKESEQKTVVALSGLMFIFGFVAAGLCFRLDFMMLPLWVTYAGGIVFVSSYIIYAIIMKQNKYLFRTVKVVQGQRVVDTGFYGCVRHPMYGATVFLFLSIPLVLGSVISLVVFAAYPVIIAKRIKNEEELLEKELDGYKEYKEKVKYKMIPFIW